MTEVFHGIYVKMCKSKILVMDIKQKGVIFMKDKIKVKFKDINDVSKFVRIVSQYDGDFDLISGRYVVDAKSIMGIFSLDLSKPIQLSLPSAIPELMEELKPYII